MWERYQFIGELLEENLLGRNSQFQALKLIVCAGTGRNTQVARHAIHSCFTSDSLMVGNPRRNEGLAND